MPLSSNRGEHSYLTFCPYDTSLVGLQGGPHVVCFRYIFSPTKINF